ncbi:MAG: bifunctional hydroxymethylpyrimidine kinase/phosphomethylpyrimidine kinase [Rubritalea sp.]|uniref:bifunctional hydroxymethylpyrimidine kinase/phosphomethylpyrimidine kinase n=1 Tax=Rubritalea sp. TaxID=2109375 RepID=UPI003241D4D4
MHKPQVVLSIAGSDCSSGAGIQADLKAFSYFGTHGLTAITCVVAETPNQVISIHPIPLAILQDQIRILLETYQIKAIKTGMLYSKSHIVAITEILQQQPIPIIVDPVMVATSGAHLLKDDAVDAYINRLLPLAQLVTPNLAEASVLLNQDITQLDQLEGAAKEISSIYNISCLVKGGHLPAENNRVDVLWHEGKPYLYSAPTVEIESTHGTGCALSAAITANIAKGLAIPDAVQSAKDWVHSAISESFFFKSSEGDTVQALNQLSPGALN